MSSRSHAILQITIDKKDKNDDSFSISSSKLTFVDLAGSERAAITENKGLRLHEGAMINKSLLALGNCINLLSQKFTKGLRNLHIPFRDSKLTRILKESLSGNCKTIMIANVSPSVMSFEDTAHSLKYAFKAKFIGTCSKINMRLASNNTMIDFNKKLYESQNNQSRDPNSNAVMDGIKNDDREDNTRFEQSSSKQNYDDFSQIKLMNNIQTHFADEIKAKNEQHELIFSMEKLQQKISLMTNEMLSSGSNLSEKISQLELAKQDFKDQIEFISSEYEKIKEKRATLQLKISAEKNIHVKAYIESVFNQNILTMENLELKNRDKLQKLLLESKDAQITNLRKKITPQTENSQSPKGNYTESRAKTKINSENKIRTPKLQNDIKANQNQVTHENSNSLFWLRDDSKRATEEFSFLKHKDTIKNTPHEITLNHESNLQKISTPKKTYNFTPYSYRRKLNFSPAVVNPNIQNRHQVNKSVDLPAIRSNYQEESFVKSRIIDEEDVGFRNNLTEMSPEDHSRKSRLKSLNRNITKYKKIMHQGPYMDHFYRNIGTMPNKLSAEFQDEISNNLLRYDGM